jgi:hypothetical protein
MKTETWKKQLGHRGRLPWAIVIHNGIIYPFTGVDIPWVCTITGQTYEKKGRWSITTYHLALPNSARFIAGHEGWGTGLFLEGLQSALPDHPPVERWADLANALGVTLPEAQKFLRGFRPEEAARLDLVEAAVASLVEAEDNLDGDVEDLTLTFGAPTRRQMEAGYWEAPVVVLLDDEEVGRVTPGGSSMSWATPVTQGRVTVLSATPSDGTHGGYVSLRLRVPAGARAKKLETI